jgi:hypothetical protein
MQQVKRCTAVGALCPANVLRETEWRENLTAAMTLDGG